MVVPIDATRTRDETEQEEDAPAAPSVGDRLLAFQVRVVSWLFAHMPEFLAYGVAEALAPLLVFMTKRRERRIAPLGRGMVRNQRIVFRDEFSEEMSREHMRAWARHMTHMAVDFCRMVRWDRERMRKAVDVSDVERLRELHAEGNGVICASGHLGVWEFCGHVVALEGMPALAVSRPASNQALVEVLTKIRTSGGQRIIEKWGVLWPLRKALSRGEVIGLAADENDHERPAFVPFLGTLAATNTSPAFLATRTGAPIAVISCHRVGRAKFRFHVWEVIRVERSRADSDELAEITARISTALSRAIRAYPEQWLWGSRRFLTRPEGEVMGPDGLPPAAPTRPPVAPTRPPAAPGSTPSQENA